MNILIKRIDQTDNGIFGQLSLDWDPFTCVTLENPNFNIPTGTYPIGYNPNSRFGCTVPVIMDVPGRSSIEIHYGNFDTDSEGCVLVGTTRDGNAIDNSREALTNLMGVLNEQPNITLTIL